MSPKLLFIQILFLTVQSKLTLLPSGTSYPSTKIFSIDWEPEIYEMVIVEYENVTGKYVLLDYAGYEVYAPGKYYFDIPLNLDVLAAQNRGARGVLWISEKFYTGSYGFLLTNDGSITIPVMEVSRPAKSIFNMLTNNNSIFVNVTSDPNIFEIYFHSPEKISYMVILSIWWLGIILLAIVKCLNLSKISFQLNLATICLFLEICTALFRIVLIILSPMHWNETFRLPNSLLVNSIAFPFEVSASAFMIFFWLDLTTGKLKASKKILGRYQNLAIGFCIMLFLIEFSVVLTMSFVPDPGAADWLTFIYVGFGFLIAIFYHISGIRLWVYSRKIKTKSRVRKMNIQVQISGVVIIIAAFVGTIQINIDTTPSLNVGLWSIIWILLGTKSITQIMVFGTKKKTKKVHTHIDTNTSNTQVVVTAG